MTAAEVVTILTGSFIVVGQLVSAVGIRVGAKESLKASAQAAQIAAAAVTDSAAVKAHADSNTAWMQTMASRQSELETLASSAMDECRKASAENIKLMRELHEVQVEFSDWKHDSSKREEDCAQKVRDFERRLRVCEETAGRVGIAEAKLPNAADMP